MPRTSATYACGVVTAHSCVMQLVATDRAHVSSHSSLRRRGRRLAEYANEIEGVEEVEFRGGLRMLANVYDNLHPYQRTGVRWLWELHQQGAGGIVGDEMGECVALPPLSPLPLHSRLTYLAWPNTLCARQGSAKRFKWPHCWGR